MAKAAGFDVYDRNIRDLKGNSPVLTLIRHGFAQLLDSDKLEVSTFQESLGYQGSGLLNGKVGSMILLPAVTKEVNLDRPLTTIRSSRTNHPSSAIAMNE